MSEYTREEILKMIEEVGGPQNLDLSGKDLSGIDLSKKAITQELVKYQEEHPGKTPIWFWEKTGGMNLQGATLKEADLMRANLEGAHLEGANLWWAHLKGANLAGTHLEGADLLEAYLERANLQGAYLERANLARAQLEKVDLAVAASLAGAYFYRAWLNQTRMTKEQLGGRIGEEFDKKYYEAKEAYLLLKNNFNQIGRYDDASWAYVKERQMGKMTYHPKLARKYYAKTESLPEGISPKPWTWWRFYVKYTLKWLWDWIIEWLCGYGERPLNVVAVALGVLIIIFPFLYSLTGLAPRSGQNLLPRDLFLYSRYSFASMEHPTLQATSWIAQLFTGLESLSGIGLLALLMYTLGRRISRS